MTSGEKTVHKSYHRSLLKNAYNFLEKAHIFGKECMAENKRLCLCVLKKNLPNDTFFIHGLEQKCVGGGLRQN